MRDALLAIHAQLVSCDCVFHETIGVIGRRTTGQKRPEQFDRLLHRRTALIPPASIPWVGGAAPQWWHEMLRLCRASHGALHVHDALLALTCQTLAVRFLVSFDPDFDQFVWLTRIHDAAQIATLARHDTSNESA